MTRREKRLNCWLSSESKAALEELARQQRVSLSALIEGLGLFLVRHDGDVDQMRGQIDEWMELASSVDDDRRAR